MDPLTLLAQAKEKALAGDIAGSQALRAQAAELKAIALESAPPAVNPSDRLPFAATAADAAVAEPVANLAAKSWYYNQFGTPDAAMNQVMTELYGHDYEGYSWAKNADFVRFVRTGHYDSRFQKALVYSSRQVKSLLQLGMSVAELKATQIESQDVLGGLAA